MSVVLYAAVAVLAAFLLLIFIALPRMKNQTTEEKLGGRRFAHRGLFDNSGSIPENSMSAFKAAVKCGYGIELDVHISKDGVPVVIHDSSLKRMCGCSDIVEEMPLSEIKMLCLLGTNEKIPTLFEVLSAVAGAVPLIVEIKTYKGNAGKVCRAVDAVLSGYSGKYSVESFDPLVLMWYRRNRNSTVRGILAPGIPPDCGRVTAFFLSRGAVMLSGFLTRPDFIAYDCRCKDRVLLRIIRKMTGVTTVLWTVKGKDFVNSLLKAYDAVIFEYKDNNYTV